MGLQDMCTTSSNQQLHMHYFSNNIILIIPMLAHGCAQALLGPSGAGKSTLMDILAQRKSTGNLSGFLLANGRPTTSSFIRKTAYVPQVGEKVAEAACTSTVRLALHEVTAPTGLDHAATTVVVQLMQLAGWLLAASACRNLLQTLSTQVYINHPCLQETCIAASLARAP
jgi:ABC-type cobalamin/Fe3+-siderophores transport system ATPase subunit